MNKKFISLVLAGACALSMTSIAAFAADETAVATEWGTDGNFVQDVKVESSIKTPSLKVTVPTSATVIVNPYKIAVAINGDTMDDTIISPEYAIKNESDCGVTVTVTAGAKVATATNKDVTISTKPLKGTETKKTAFMYVEATNTQGAYSPDGYIEKAIATKNLTGDDLAAAEETNAFMAKQMVLATKEASKTLIALDAKGGDVTDAWFQIKGEAASKTATPWNANDGIDVTLTLKIAPAANDAGTNGPVVSTSTARLTGITLTGDVTALDQTFNAETFSYTVACSNKDGITIAATADTGYSVTYNATAWDTEATHTIDVRTGTPITVTITVTKDDDPSDTQDYVIVFTAS